MKHTHIINPFSAEGKEQGAAGHGFLKVEKHLTRKPRKKRNARIFLVFREICTGQGLAEHLLNH
jgi:hypothetical protein